MSDTCISSVNQNRKNIDVIDEQWMTDCLSDDEIDIPKDMEENGDDDEEEPSPESAEDLWMDTGLERFSADQVSTQNIATPPQPQPQTQTQPQQQPHTHGGNGVRAGWDRIFYKGLGVLGITTLGLRDIYIG